MPGKIEDRRRIEQQRMRSLDGITDSVDMNLGQTPGDSEEQEGLVRCSRRGCRESDTT